MGRNILKRIVIFCIIFLFLSTACLPILADDKIYVQQDKLLTKEHFKYLFIGFLFIKNFKIKNIIIKIIFEINRDGSATFEEIQEIIDSSNANLEVYLMAEINTVSMNYSQSDGSVSSVPWWHALEFLPFHDAIGILIYYTPKCYKELIGWTLQVDGNLLSENDGYILGYTGYIRDYMDTIEGGEHSTFKLDGFGVLILHNKNI